MHGRSTFDQLKNFDQLDLHFCPLAIPFEPINQIPSDFHQIDKKFVLYA